MRRLCREDRGVTIDAAPPMQKRRCQLRASDDDGRRRLTSRDGEGGQVQNGRGTPSHANLQCRGIEGTGVGDQNMAVRDNRPIRFPERKGVARSQVRTQRREPVRAEPAKTDDPVRETRSPVSVRRGRSLNRTARATARDALQEDQARADKHPPTNRRGARPQR